MYLGTRSRHTLRTWLIRFVFDISTSILPTLATFSWDSTNTACFRASLLRVWPSLGDARLSTKAALDEFSSPLDVSRAIGTRVHGVLFCRGLCADRPNSTSLGMFHQRRRMLLLTNSGRPPSSCALALGITVQGVLFGVISTSGPPDYPNLGKLRETQAEISGQGWSKLGGRTTPISLRFLQGVEVRGITDQFRSVSSEATLPRSNLRAMFEYSVGRPPQEIVPSNVSEYEFE